MQHWESSKTALGPGNSLASDPPAWGLPRGHPICFWPLKKKTNNFSLVWPIDRDSIKMLTHKDIDKLTVAKLRIQLTQRDLETNGLKVYAYSFFLLCYPIDASTC
jgi:hypothetical protein